MAAERSVSSAPMPSARSAFTTVPCGRALATGWVATQVASPVVTLGASVDFLDVRYRTAGTALMVLGPPALALATAPTIASVFVERRWGPSDSAWSIMTGVRAIALLGWTARVEPRISGTVRVRPGLTLTVGYARTHQAVQSLRNLESPLDWMVGVDLPVAAGMGGIPLAQSDVGTAGLVARLGALGLFSADAYVRAMSGGVQDRDAGEIPRLCR